MNAIDQTDYDFMLSNVLPGIENLARNLPDESIGVLKAGQNGQRRLSKRHIAQILANCFFCVFKNDENLPHITFKKYNTYIVLFHTNLLIFFIGSIQSMDTTIHLGSKLANAKRKSLSVSSPTSKLLPQVKKRAAHIKHKNL